MPAIAPHGRDAGKDDSRKDTPWWKGNNVHFGGKPAAELGRLLARHVMKALGREKEGINPTAK